MKDSKPQNTRPCSVLVNSDQGTVFQVFMKLMECRKQKRTQMAGGDILTPNLNDAGAVGPRGCEYSSKVKIVGEDYVAVVQSISEKLLVWSVWLTDT